MRVIDLYLQNFSELQIAQLLQIGPPLVQEYLAVYQKHDQPDGRHRLAEPMERLLPAVAPKKGGQ